MHFEYYRTNVTFPYPILHTKYTEIVCGRPLWSAIFIGVLMRSGSVFAAHPKPQTTKGRDQDQRENNNIG